MKKYKKRQTIVLVDICCDVCGKSCKNEHAQECGDEPDLHEESDFEYGSISATWGYFSRKDGESYSAILCEDCFDKVVTYVNKMRK